MKTSDHGFDGTARQALVLFQYAKMLFSDLTLNWVRKPSYAKDFEEGWQMRYSFLHRMKGCDGCAQFLFTDRLGVFARLGGKPLLDTRPESYAFLKAKGLSVLRRSWHKSCISSSLVSDDPCPLGRCDEPKNCRCRVSEYLRCGEEWHHTDQVTMKMMFEIRPFHISYTDLNVDISILRPFLETADEDDEDGESEEDTDEDAESDEFAEDSD